MAARTRPPFRADHVGSLLRPPRLLQAREDHKAGRIDDDELRGIEDEAIRDVVRRQEEVGLRSATDGEFRRASWHMDFIYRLGGVTRAAETMTVQFRTRRARSSSRRPRCTSTRRSRSRSRSSRPTSSSLQSCVTSATPKLTIPSPSMVHYRGGRAVVDEDVYPDLDGVLERPDERVRRGGRGRWPTSAAPTCSSTTRASRTSTTPSSAR